MLGEGRANGPSRSAGVMATAWMYTGTERNTGNPMGRRGAHSNRMPARDRPGLIGWRRGSEYR